ncbi:MAG TPA: PPC domain-containing protein, partial [Nannocystis sp.]
FLWLPTLKRQSVVAGVISYADVRKLFDLANGVAPVVPQVLAHDAASLGAGAWKHYGPFTADAAGLKAVLTIAKGDADLYLRNGSKPTASAFDCRPFAEGLASETCSLGAGTWYAAVNGYATTTDFTLDVTRGQ